MKLSSNKRFEKSKAALAGAGVVRPLPSGLTRILADGIRKDRECFVFRGTKQVPDFPPSELGGDWTGYEAFANHLHIEDYAADLSPSELLFVTYTFALELRERLIAAFPSQPFTLIIASTDTEANVRFHASRPNETWVSENLEGYLDEAVAVIQTD